MEEASEGEYLKYYRSGKVHPVSRMMISQGDVLQPELQWEAFPFPCDKNMKLNQELVSGTSYEISVYSSRFSAGNRIAPGNYYMDKLLYGKKGLSNHQHRLEKALEP